MKKNDSLSYLLTALGAVSFFIAAVPILDAFGTWVSNLFGLQSVKLNDKAAKYDQSNGQDGPTHAVGFTIPNEDKDDDYE